jgi:quercetin 2,3-dioxygenase
MPDPIEIVPAGGATVAGMAVQRALPRRGRRTVGAWCFADHFGPGVVGPDTPVAIGPHPHLGLQTVTWLLEGVQRHRDSLGSDQVIRAGQLNLMTAGRGVVHAEETLDYRGPIHGVQLWIALPDAHRRSAPDFEHLAELPQVVLGTTVGTVLVGSWADGHSPAGVHSSLVGVDLRIGPGATQVPLEAAFEHAVLALTGTVTVDGVRVAPGTTAHLGAGRTAMVIHADRPARALLLGGTPLEVAPLLWWNFVARTGEEVAEARRQWEEGDPRFGPVASDLPRMPAPDLVGRPVR